ncbi:MAG: hypothetical protein O3B83_03280 [Bacteroidetes bacterium]|nr:hypothetical protein [Bacteroidota bacterium]
MKKPFKHFLRIAARSPKVFCLGANKTGTTSFEGAMKDLGYRMPLQKDFELLFDDWVKRDFGRIIKMVSDYEAFQDVPFSLPFTFVALDQAFPGSKFVLTIRNSEEDWYQSITRFHAKMWGKEGRIPSRDDLRESTYLYKGRPDHTNRHIFNPPYDDPYHKETLLAFYRSHIEQVMTYFRYRPEDLLVINVAEEEAYEKLCAFIDRQPIYPTFPWKNKT